RPDCISNRNVKIIATYLYHKTGTISGLFEGLQYPSYLFRTPEEFFLNEEEWTALSNFYTILRRARERVREPNFFFNCGFSAANLSSWGKLGYFTKLFSSPTDGFKRLGFFNKQFNDTKEIRVAIHPYYDKSEGLMKTVILIQYHEDMDPNEDMMGDLYTRGILSSIPTLWNLPPANIKCIMAPYDPIRILESLKPEKELLLRWKGKELYLREGQEEKKLGELVRLLPEEAYEGLFLGRHRPLSLEEQIKGDTPCALLMSLDLTLDELTVENNTILMAPYFVLDITYERMSVGSRLRCLIPSKGRQEATQMALMQTIEELRRSVQEKSIAYAQLENVNNELRRIKETQERLIEERTAELERARGELTVMNEKLQREVELKSEELKRIEFLKRYLSPSVMNYLLGKGQTEIPFRRKFVTIMFVDIRDFSTFSEINEPEDTMDILNKYFDNIIKLIHAYEGTIYKILGDGIIIVFNDIIEIEDHAYRAVKLAWEIKNLLNRLNRELHDNIDVGIGINSGYVSLGTIGSSLFKDYAIIGKEMNLTARIQGLAGPNEILITKRTLSLLKTSVKVEERGETLLKGFSKPVRLYRVIGFE
ncbi:MAG: adenylate/guanylate cyclase domain-containing protein, partial [Desulfatiglandales bacterium]